MSEAQAPLLRVPLADGTLAATNAPIGTSWESGMEKRTAGYAVAIVAVSILGSCAKGNERLTMRPNS